MGVLMSPISDDDDPTRDDVRVRLGQELSVEVDHHTIKETVEKEITNKIVQAIAVFARDVNPGFIIHRHCRLVMQPEAAPLATQATDDASIPIEE
jgi:hypothetical protein